MTPIDQMPITGQPDQFTNVTGRHDLQGRKPRHLGPQLSTPLINTVEDTGDSLYLSVHATKRPEDAHVSEGHGPKPEPLNSFIREAMLTCQESNFLPLDCLDMVVTVPNICQELKLSNASFDVNTTARQVWNLETLPNGDLTTRRKIFVILCLMERPIDIQGFIEEGIFDADLPFEFEQHEGICRSGRRIKLFADWKFHSIDNFKSYQGQVLAPYFKLSNDADPRFLEYKLHNCVQLPFVDHEFKSIAPGNSELQSAIRREGGYSLVRKADPVKTDHRSSEKTCFAVKELRKRENATDNQDHEPDRETTAYKYLNGRRHSHIIQLLATFTQKGQLNLIFPWADGNLLDFWKTQYPGVSDLPRDKGLAEWIIGQLLGLVDAIRCIHHSEVEEIAIYDGPDRSKTHGRHGDIKPENMLWFKRGYDGSQARWQGKIVISDLGSTEFHATRSKTIPAEAAGGYTNTYRAPEFDKTRRVAAEADIWSFGCVVLEFLIWFVRGWDGVSKFTRARSDDSNLNFHADHFFNLVLKEDENSEDTVVVKNSVIKECQMLRQDPTAPGFIVDLVDFVGARLLEPDSAKRATCDEIVEKLHKVQGKCRSDLEYSVPQKRSVIVRAPTDISHETSISLSAEMRKDYQMNMKPTPRTTHPTPSASTPGKLTSSAISHINNILLDPLAESQFSGYRHSTGQDFVQTRPMKNCPSLVTDDGRIEATSPASKGPRRIYQGWRSRVRGIKEKYFRMNSKS
ncbi:serine threonine protein kinase [Stemphylium lycopersici]|uniref:Kinase-like protein n=1 Tax=Stemphylium lycopersici TaxID=183478 RepID=A0A364MX70_STELY|nr:serine threonine protein kinase [Stemphylium lycopersici]RAR06237.1 kinase-like protein [Stemphylium lycopersici]